MTDTITTSGEDSISLHEVTLIAESIQVTADDEATATRYALSDAKEFRRDWNVHQVIVDAAGMHAEAAKAPTDIQVEVQKTGVEEDIWTFEAHFRMTVAARHGANVIAIAHDLMKS